ncbi:MAG: MFS transporter [Candidatus Aminicenantes bacterium]|nr:MFS transporter [Candidatus Aminicenantes bacterium]
MNSISAPPPAADRRLILLITTTSSFLTPFMGSALNIALPSIGAEFGLDAVALGWVATSYMLAAAVFLVPFGRLADIAGRKKIFISGVILYTAASLLSALAVSGSMLIAVRVLQGWGGSMIFGTATALLISVYPPGQRGAALGINTAAVYTGLSLGPVLGGLLTQSFGWRSIFLLHAGLGALLTALVLLLLKQEWREARGEPFDAAGSLLFGLALVSLMYGFSRLPDAPGFVLIGAGTCLAALFLRYETKIAHPVLNLSLFLRNRIFAFSNLAALINYSATAASGFLLSLYLQYVKGLSPRQAGLVLVAQPVVMAVVSPLTGRLSDRIEPRWLASAGMALSAGGLFLLAFLQIGSPLSVVTGCLVLLGMGFGLFSSPNTNAVMSSVDKRSLGVASATLATMRLTGQMFSMGMSLLVIALYLGRVRITAANHPAFMDGLRSAYFIFVAFCAAGVFASLARGRTPGRRRPESG